MVWKSWKIAKHDRQADRGLRRRQHDDEDRVNLPVASCRC